MAFVALNLNKRQSKFAFTVESYHSPYNQKNDPRYVKYLFRVYGKPLNLNEKQFRFAFTVESYQNPKKQKNDPKYVKYLFRLYGKRNGKEF